MTGIERVIDRLTTIQDRAQQELQQFHSTFMASPSDAFYRSDSCFTYAAQLAVTTEVLNLINVKSYTLQQCYDTLMERVKVNSNHRNMHAVTSVARPARHAMHLAETEVMSELCKFIERSIR
jgi:hypothetical protein